MSCLVVKGSLSDLLERLDGIRVEAGLVKGILVELDVLVAVDERLRFMRSSCRASSSPRSMWVISSWYAIPSCLPESCLSISRGDVPPRYRY